MDERRGRVLSVNVVTELRPDGNTGRVTAIDKRPVDGRVRVGVRGLEGDQQIDTRHHGGPDQALYAYARKDLDDWAAELGRDLPNGAFGENLTLEGIPASDALIGEQWRIGADGPDAVLVEATLPRLPCATFARWMGESHWVRRFAERGRFGCYLRVVRPGTIGAGDEVTVVRRPDHGVRIGDTFRRLSAGQTAAVLQADEAGEIELSEKLRETLVHR